MPDFDDLLGGHEPPPARGRGRPRKQLPPEPFNGDFGSVAHGITAATLAAYFRMNRKAVAEALRDCVPLRSDRHGALLYDFVEACSYLVEPKRDMRAFLRNITDKDLPQELREPFWNAKIKEMKARTMAGDLWHSSSVLEVFGETFKTIKTTTQLWMDTIDEASPLSNDQRDELLKLVDKLMADLHGSLIANAKSTSTESFLSELEDAAL